MYTREVVRLHERQEYGQRADFGQQKQRLGRAQEAKARVLREQEEEHLVVSGGLAG